ncbi:MAG: sulfur carrier protein ThiS [Magnetococcales bacterium]|nr:sulfur carrier protein ThiS [Magnetococcales bacterium]
MNIILNGEPHEVPEQTTLSQLLTQLQFDPSRVAIEHNLEVAPREGYHSVVLAEGDQIEIVHFIGGGSLF